MRKPLSAEELEKLDAELIASGMQVNRRAVEMFQRTYSSVPDGPERSTLFSSIYNWLNAKYGRDAEWDGVIGRYPILITGKVYLGCAQFVLADTVVNFAESIEAFLSEIATSLTIEEIRTIMDNHGQAGNRESELQ